MAWEWNPEVCISKRRRVTITIFCYVPVKLNFAWVPDCMVVPIA